jgi:hypothetical protein
MKKLPLTTQTLYAELMEQLAALEAHRSIGSLPGCFTTKTVKGVPYVYFQNIEPGGITRQIYLGRKSPAIEKVMSRFQEERTDFSADTENIQSLCAQLREGGAITTDTPSARVIKALSDCGVFRLEGVLIGTHAFSILGNLLGVYWTGASLKTHDIDIAGVRVVGIVLPNIQVDLPEALESLKMGFFPVPPLNLKQPSTSFKVRGNPLRVDVLTPADKIAEIAPVTIPRFRTAAQPLPFLDFLIEKPVQGAVVNGGGILVHVPAPARFALHKLIVAQERDVSKHDKVEKDVMQAAQIIRMLADERPGDLRIAWDDIIRRGERWLKRIKAGIKRMSQSFPKEAEDLKRIVKLS